MVPPEDHSDQDEHPGGDLGPRAGGGIEERTAFAAEVRDMVWRETRRRMGYVEGKGPHSVNALSPTSAAARREPADPLRA